MMYGLQSFAGLAIYWAIIALMMTGLYAVIARENLIKKIMGLSLFQSSAILFYVTMAKVEGGTAPILVDPTHEQKERAQQLGNVDSLSESFTGAVGEAAPTTGQALETVYSNPLPHVLMLTAIVVGVATLALALAIVVRIQDQYGTVEECEIVRLDLRQGLSRVLRKQPSAD